MKKIRQRNLQLILDAACEVFADCGFSAARLSDVAERAGVAKANVLYYCGGKHRPPGLRRLPGTPRRGRAASAFPRAGWLSDLRQINFRVALYSKSHSEPLSLRQPRPPTSFAPHRSTP